MTSHHLRLHRATLVFIGVVAVVAAATLTMDGVFFTSRPEDQLSVSVWALALILACSVIHALVVQRSMSAKTVPVQQASTAVPMAKAQPE